MIIPINTRVRIKKGGVNVTPECIIGSEGKIIGYADDPPTSISLHRIELDGDPMFKWPKLFSWDLETLNS